MLLSVVLLGDPAAAQPGFVPGELLVQFAPGSAGTAALAKALQTEPPDLWALEPAVADLSSAAGIPLQASRVAGGNWVVVAVRAAELARQAAVRLATHPNIESVEEFTPGPGLPAAGRDPPGLGVRFRPRSPQAASLDQGVSGGADDHAARLARELAEFLGLPLRGAALPGPGLRIDIDMPALTMVLLERLRPLAGLQAVQPNYRLGIRPPP